MILCNTQGFENVARTAIQLAQYTVGMVRLRVQDVENGKIVSIAGSCKCETRHRLLERFTKPAIYI